MATTEGTLVASYNRGMRLLTQAGGVKTTVVDDSMQRAPVFILDDARAARELATWIRSQPRRHPGRCAEHHISRAARSRSSSTT